MAIFENLIQLATVFHFSQLSFLINNTSTEQEQKQKLSCSMKACRLLKPRQFVRFVRAASACYVMLSEGVYPLFISPLTIRNSRWKMLWKLLCTCCQKMPVVTKRSRKKRWSAKRIKKSSRIFGKREKENSNVNILTWMGLVKLLHQYHAVWSGIPSVWMERRMFEFFSKLNTIWILKLNWFRRRIWWYHLSHVFLAFKD